MEEIAFNEYKEWYINEYNKEVYRIIKVSNTYPVLLKLREACENNKEIPYNLQKRRRGQTFSDYIEELCKNLIRFNKKIYQEHSGDITRHKVLKKYPDSSIEQILYNDFKLIFLKSDTDLIMLNYFPKNIKVSRVVDFEIANFRKNRAIHVRKLEIEGKVYKTINTYDAFVPFADSMGEEPNLGLNDPFFEAFHKSLKREGIITSNTSGCCCNYEFDSLLDLLDLMILGQIFYYYILNNIIIINDYGIREKETEYEVESSEEEYLEDIFSRVESGVTGYCSICGNEVYDGDSLCSICANNID
ncbi:hypothetical protein [Thermohalobacter berrensis]|uniref:Uncharacterized protein n=1 Tax=Thermohalobacter berrensis TaxID=99594 RepID=A0A419T3C1_9FIRM|nr:hypothetical protein [Thermohalobacter berrensis]RKD31945.1 hypothetical protein BET03_11735 [Thermohalobacter berrensis]